MSPGPGPGALLCYTNSVVRTEVDIPLVCSSAGFTRRSSISSLIIACMIVHYHPRYLSIDVIFTVTKLQGYQTRCRSGDVAQMFIERCGHGAARHTGDPASMPVTPTRLWVPQWAGALTINGMSGCRPVTTIAVNTPHQYSNPVSSPKF